MSEPTKPVEEMTWDEHQAWERRWWGSCINTFAEEAKQITYAHRMGLVVSKHPEFYETWPLYDMRGQSVVDIGGGPCSLLLKTRRLWRGTVVDPCEYPPWTAMRYAAAGIMLLQRPGEVSLEDTYDEAWIYNVLQHVQNPEAILINARRSAKLVRVFEWIDRGIGPGHPHALTAERLDAVLGSTGKTEDMKGENNCHGMSYFGVFPGLK